ncbi:AMP-binding protein [Fulvivirgaceae bacterium BMA12]|uniref:Long-chain-fatty-acid--CoA ligase n=1 Tax=Agaribacillus aureus TaxID=3051825 RepID=A0ABT8L349_9BACT|nr:AMP-binding protein [Fulvivirgaceae bacterium BMA12]
MENYPWYNSYPAGVPKEINPDHYKSILDLFEECVEKYADLTAYVNMGASLTYRELDQESKKFAAYLQNVGGLERGDRVAIQMPNLLQFPIALFGVLRAGMVAVNTNPLYTSREMAHQFADSGAKAVVILTNFACNLEKILAETSIELVITTELGDLLGGIKGHIVNFVVKKVKKMVPPFNLPAAIPFKQVLKEGKRYVYHRPEVNGGDLAFLQYTGGTTGVSKGAMLTHRNMVSNMEQNGGWMGVDLVDGEEVIITALPLYHIFALTVNCLTMMKKGAKNILITNPRDMPAFVKELKKHPFSVITGVNTLFNGLLNQQAFRSLDFGKLKFAVGGGMAVQDTVALEWKRVTGKSLAEGYGLTETSPVLSCNPLNGSEVLGTIGLPFPSTEIKLIDEDGQVVALGEIGEICARGPQVMKGYWQRPEETANVFMVDWLKTGDMGTMDDKGFFRIVDRKKEMINVSGFNVYPNEIENVIAMMDGVLEVGVIGVPDQRSTEAVKAFIVRKNESITENEIMEHCKENMTGYKVPKFIEFREELPKSNVGKILRRLLKEGELAD